MGMKHLEFNIENIGNIDHAKVTIKSLTIIAGENSTGKTFITKSLYTVLDSVYKNHFFREFISSFFMLESSFLDYFEDITPTSKDTKFYKIFIDMMNEIENNVIYELANCKFKEQENILLKNKDLFHTLNLETRLYIENRKKVKKFSKYINQLNDIETNIKDFQYIIENRTQVIINNISNSLEEGFKKNFQITNLTSLIKQGKSKKIKIELDNLGNVEIEQNNLIQFSLKQDGIEEIQNVENIVFFDSPVYLKIRKALQDCRQSRISILKDEEKYLKGYPQYLDRLYSFIDKEYIDTSDFNLISQEIQETIKGSFNVSKSGDIQYIDKENNIMPLSLTAMGISNIGLIDLLLRNNVINKGSFLIMDEPEAHLHPDWQVILAKVLYKIAKQGANIIIATHSLDFLKAFQTILKTEKDSDNIIAINKMPYNKKFADLPELGKVNLVLNNLSDAFYKLHLDTN